MPVSAASESLLAQLYPTGSTSLLLQDFTTAQQGMTVVCLSGGGSRALTAGMGQLKGLRTVNYDSDTSLLSMVTGLSTVSGGSWVGVPFVYLPASVALSDYLGGPYVDPSKLTLSGIASLPQNCIASHITSDFTLADMLAQATLLSLVGVPANMLWQTIIGLHLLVPYGLFEYSSRYRPNSFFTYTSATLEAILADNPSLNSETANLVRGSNPYLICNIALAVTAAQQALFAPVQSTSIFTGVMSTPPGAADANGNQVGGGGVSSFAFSSAPTKLNASSQQITVSQQRQWALVDAVGSSSAAFAEVLQSVGSSLSRQPDLLPSLLRERQPAALNFLKRRNVNVTNIQTRLYAVQSRSSPGVSPPTVDLSALQNLIPEYSYWPVSNPPVGQTIRTTQFADGGSLENTGIAAALSYSDVLNLIAFINAQTTLSIDENSTVIVDDSIPPLFGYQPYQTGTGYALYAGSTNPHSPFFQNSQVFPSESFQPLLTALWAASGSGNYSGIPMVSQELRTVRNDWFKVAGSQSVTLLWVYLERVQAWYDALPQDIQRFLGPFDSMIGNFPHFSTIWQTQLSPMEVTLLANFTAWVVVTAQGQFKELFSSGSKLSS